MTFTYHNNTVIDTISITTYTIQVDTTRYIVHMIAPDEIYVISHTISLAGQHSSLVIYLKSIFNNIHTYTIFSIKLQITYLHSNHTLRYSLKHSKINIKQIQGIDNLYSYSNQTQTYKVEIIYVYTITNQIRTSTALTLTTTNKYHIIYRLWYCIWKYVCVCVIYEITIFTS